MTHRLPRLALALLAILGAALLQGCGTESEENYVFDLSGLPEKSRTRTREMFREFNFLLGEELLREPAIGERAMSSITLVEDLQLNNSGRVGEGRWRTSTRREMSGGRITKITELAMELHFDARAYERAAGGSLPDDREYIWKLFCHEVGHGLGFDHDSKDQHSVMHPVLMGEKDFDAYFKAVPLRSLRSATDEFRIEDLL